MKSPSRLFVSLATGALCALAGLLLEIIGATIAWTVFRGIQAILFALVVGGLTAFLIRRTTHLPASSIAGAVGACVAAFAAIACMEVFEPGSLEWAIKGGLFGAAWGLPVGAILGPIGLLHRQRKAEPVAAPNGGRAASLGNSGAAKGPPSVS